jgi:hypothetical protein
MVVAADGVVALLVPQHPAATTAAATAVDLRQLDVRAAGAGAGIRAGVAVWRAGRTGTEARPRRRAVRVVSATATAAAVLIRRHAAAAAAGRLGPVLVSASVGSVLR